jgi:hypothetical protein
MKHSMSCGPGIAARATLPTRLAELASAMADLLASHQPAIDVSDVGGAKELRAYQLLEDQYRSAAAQLAATARAMAAAAELPAVRHDVTVLTSAANRDAFSRFVAAERELQTALASLLQGDGEMLAQMHSA